MTFNPVESPVSANRAPRIARVRRLDELPEAVHALGLELQRPVLVLVGGANALEGAALERLRPLFVDGLAPFAESLGAAVIDGGTDAGVMRLMGEAREATAATFPLVGVAPFHNVSIPGERGSDNRMPLEEHHSHVILAPVDSWDEGSQWLSHLAELLAGDDASATVLIDGGDVSWTDAEVSIEAGRPLVAVGNTGRVADALAAAAAGDTTNAKAQELVASGLLRAVDLNAGPEAVVAAIGAALGNRA